MKTRLMNMVKIINSNTNEVVVLDKIKKEGWEGLTFPGGKAEIGEPMTTSVIREAKEETGLDIKNPKLVGVITWHSKELTDVGFLYETCEYEGELITENREGHLSWINFDEFLKMDGMSLSMDKILKIYDGIYSEIYWDVDHDNIKYFK